MASRKPRLYIMYGTYSERGNRPEDRLMEARPPYVPAKRPRRQGLRLFNDEANRMVCDPGAKSRGPGQITVKVTCVTGESA
jgi:hypothetical protein